MNKINTFLLFICWSIIACNAPVFSEEDQAPNLKNEDTIKRFSAPIDTTKWDLVQIQDYVNSIDELSIKTNCDCLEKMYDLEIFAYRLFPDKKAYDENINAEQIKGFLNKKRRRIMKECDRTNEDNVESCLYYSKYLQLKDAQKEKRKIQEEKTQDELLDKVLNR